jgi:hypothetical protein
MRPTPLVRRFPSAYTLFNRLMNLPAWIADSLGGKRKQQRNTTRLNVESMEDRVVPTTMSLLYDFSDDGGTLSSGLNRTLTVGQTLVVDAEVAKTTDGITASPASPTPTGTVTFTLTYGGLMVTTYTIGLTALTDGGSYIGAASLITTDLPLTPDSYELNASYSGDSNYSSTSVSDIASITINANPSGAPPALAPVGGQGSLPIPSGDGVAASVGMASTGVIYGTGGINISRTDLTSNGSFATPWGEGWNWSNASYADSISGLGAAQTQAPHLVSINSGTTIAVVDGGTADFFDLYGSAFHPRFGLDAVLTHNSGAGTYVLNLAGNTYTFNDFSGYDSSVLSGSLMSVSDAYGDTTSVLTWNSAGAPTDVERTNGSGSTEVYADFVSTYITSGVNTGLLSTVTQEYKIGSGSFTTIATATYTYYGSGLDPNGEEGDLETAIVEDASSNILSATYYRYDGGNLSYVVGTCLPSQ